MPEVFTVRELSEKTGLSTRTIYRWLALGKIRGKKQGNEWEIDGESVLDLIHSARAAQESWLHAEQRANILGELYARALNESLKTLAGACRQFLTVYEHVRTAKTTVEEDRAMLREAVDDLAVAVRHFDATETLAVALKQAVDSALEARAAAAAWRREVLETDSAGAHAPRPGSGSEAGVTPLPNPAGTGEASKPENG